MIPLGVDTVSVGWLDRSGYRGNEDKVETEKGLSIENNIQI